MSGHQHEHAERAQRDWSRDAIRRLHCVERLEHFVCFPTFWSGDVSIGGKRDESGRRILLVAPDLPRRWLPKQVTCPRDKLSAQLVGFHTQPVVPPRSLLQFRCLMLGNKACVLPGRDLVDEKRNLRSGLASPVCKPAVPESWFKDKMVGNAEGQPMTGFGRRTIRAGN